MILKTLKRNFIESLSDYYPKEESEAFFYRLSEHILRMKRIDIALNNYTVISGKKREKFERSLARLKEHEPIQYIAGNTEFFGLKFKVNPNVLIPRPETEELVDWIIQDSKNMSSKLKILDIGTGSGCIPITLAKNLSNAEVEAVDISEKALEIAKENAKLNQVDARFNTVDILNETSWQLAFNDCKFNVVVSNPPYVKQSEQELMQSNVLEYEPHLALFVDNEDPLEFYRAIVKFCDQYLVQHGLLYFEINEALGEEMIKLLEDFNYKSIVLKQDIFGKNRMIKAIKS